MDVVANREQQGNISAPSFQKVASPQSHSEGGIAQGITLYNEGKVQEALDFFLSMTASEKEKSNLLYYIGLCCASLSRYDDAMTYLEQVVTEGGETKSGEELGKEAAEKRAERVLQCRLILSVVYTLTGRHSLAEFEMQKLLDAGYKEENVYCAAAFMAYEERDVDKSISYYERALECDKNCITALNGLGYVLCLEGRNLTRALECCSRAVQATPTAACLDSLGCVYMKLGMKEKGTECLQRALEIASSAQAEVIKEHLGGEGNDETK